MVVVAGIGDAGFGVWDRAFAATMIRIITQPSADIYATWGVWIDWPIYFITTCTLKRRRILASRQVAEILADEWRAAHQRHDFAIGRYVIMPDHVHFFCSAELNAKRLPTFMQAWKQWTSKQMARAQFSWKRLAEEFFDRSSESYNQNWKYVKENPVRAGLVTSSDEWLWQEEIESLML